MEEQGLTTAQVTMDSRQQQFAAKQHIAWSRKLEVLFARGPGKPASGACLNHKNWSAQFQTRPQTLPADSWRAKPGPVPVNTQILPGVARLVGSNLRFPVSCFTFMVAFRYAPVDCQKVPWVRYSPFMMY